MAMMAINDAHDKCHTTNEMRAYVGGLMKSSLSMRKMEITNGELVKVLEDITGFIASLKPTLAPQDLEDLR